MALNWTNVDKRRQRKRDASPRSRFLAEVDKQIGFCQTWLKGETPTGARGGAADIWWAENDEEWILRPKYGPKPLAGPDGSNAISVGKKSNILPVLMELRAEVEKGQLDAVIEEAATRKSRRGRNPNNLPG